MASHLPWAAELRVYVVPLGSASASRRAVWQRAVGACAPPEATHVACAPELTRERSFEEQSKAKH